MQTKFAYPGFLTVLATVAITSSCSHGGKGSAPELSSITVTENPPMLSSIRWSVGGKGFNQDSVRVFFKGPGCPNGCEAPTRDVKERSATKLSGIALLGTGTYQLSVKNGDGESSNELSLDSPSTKAAVDSPAPVLTGVSVVNGPKSKAAITWTVAATGIDPQAVHAIFQGPGCPNGCEVPPSDMKTKTPTKISGYAVLGTGSYKLFLRNGDSAVSNAMTVESSSAPPHAGK